MLANEETTVETGEGTKLPWVKPELIDLDQDQSEVTRGPGPAPTDATMTLTS